MVISWFLGQLISGQDRVARWHHLLDSKWINSSLIFDGIRGKERANGVENPIMRKNKCYFWKKDQIFLF